MRYLRNVQTGEIVPVGYDDDATFFGLTIQRHNARPLYEQTGAHDPDVVAYLAEQTPDEPEDEPEDLDALKREELDARAAAAGVPDPAGLPNKAAVIDAIRTMQDADGEDGEDAEDADDSEG